MKASGISLQDFDRRLGETETLLLEGTQKVVWALGARGRGSDPIGDRPDLPASVGGPPAEVRCGCGTPRG